jgi:hypothetical protein
MRTTIQMTPGDDTHLTLLMAPQSLNFFTGQDREHLLAFGRAAFEAGKATAEQGKCLHQIAEPAEDIWPCINLDVDEHGAVTNAKLYTPGLPAGNHDVYPVRVPYMDEHTEAWLTCVKELEKFDPTFLNREGMNGIECAASLIRELVGRAQDAARWREAIKTVGAESHISGSRYVIRGLEAPANVMRGSVAEHFTKSIDTALAAQAKQEQAA